MAVNGNQSCYCCSHAALSMDIDAALDELGMLSTVTDSRKQYLQERMRIRSESALLAKRATYQGTHSLPPSETRSLPPSTSSSSYQILHIDPNYVTGFFEASPQQGTETTHPVPPASAAIQIPESKSEEIVLDHCKDYRNPPDNLESSLDRRRKMMLKYRFRREDFGARSRRILARKRAKEPYEVPWRLTQSFQESDLMTRLDDIPESKSNSSSPVKSYSIDTLPRSRSLDNLDFSSFFISEAPGERQEMENVAMGMRNLNVSDS